MRTLKVGVGLVEINTSWRTASITVRDGDNRVTITDLIPSDVRWLQHRLAEIMIAWKKTLENT